MAPKPVKSSNLKTVDYDPVTREMTVEFNNGSTCCYCDVPPDAHDKLLGADSIGSHFHANIRSAFKTKARE